MDPTHAPVRRVQPVHDHSEPWDDSDVRGLRALRLRGLTIAECAERLGRTVNAVRSKLYRLSRPRWDE